MVSKTQINPTISTGGVVCTLLSETSIKISLNKYSVMV